MTLGREKRGFAATEWRQNDYSLPFNEYPWERKKKQTWKQFGSLFMIRPKGIKAYSNNGYATKPKGEI